MNQTVYYIFSTMAQVLAAAIALSGVFAIFKLQAIGTTLSGLAQSFYDEVRQEFKNHPYKGRIQMDENGVLDKMRNLKKAKLTYDYNQIIKEIKNFMDEYRDILNSRESLSQNITHIKDEYEIVASNRAQTRSRTIWTTIYTGLIIIITTILLWILPDAVICTKSWVIGVMILLYSLSIYFIIRLIIKSL